MNSNGIGIMKKYIEKHYIDKMLNASSTLMSIIKKATPTNFAFC